MKSSRLFSLVLAILLVCSLVPLASAKTIQWKMASSWPDGTILQWAANDFAETVGKMSGGRLVIKSYAAGVLMGALEVMDGVKTGSIDAGHSSPAYQIGKLKAGPLFGYIPFGMEAIPFLTWFYHNEGQALYQELYAQYNLGYATACGMLPAENLAWSNKPIKAMGDFKGLKFRTSGYWGEILTEAGAAVVMLPAGEIYEALQRKVLDAGEFSVPSMDKDLAFHETAKYLLVPGIHQPSTMLDITINERSWKALPDDLKVIVQEAAQATTLKVYTRCINEDIKALAFFKEKGIQIEYLDPAIQKELLVKSNALLDRKAAEDPFFSKVLDSQRKFMTSYRNYQDLMSSNTK
jgi:TRAP-type mannitol/chloroaromatic compound transport system substrate-binding protein